MPMERSMWHDVSSMAWFSRQSPRMKSRAGPTSGTAGLRCSSGLSREERRIEVSARLYHACVRLGRQRRHLRPPCPRPALDPITKDVNKPDSLGRPRHAANARGIMAAMGRPPATSPACVSLGRVTAAKIIVLTKVLDRPSPCAARNPIAVAELDYPTTSCVPSVLQTDVQSATHGW